MKEEHHFHIGYRAGPSDQHHQFKVPLNMTDVESIALDYRGGTMWNEIPIWETTSFDEPDPETVDSKMTRFCEAQVLKQKLREFHLASEHRLLLARLQQPTALADYDFSKLVRMLFSAVPTWYPQDRLNIWLKRMQVGSGQQAEFALVKAMEDIDLVASGGGATAPC